MPEVTTAGMTREETLAQINAAISTILVGGQSYSMGSRSLTRADLGKLVEMRAQLESEIAVETDGRFLSRTYAAEFDGR